MNTPEKNILEKFAVRFEAISKFGFRRYAQVRIERTFLWGLSLIFRFHPWHVIASDSSREYRRAIAKIVNSLQPKVVVEVGCGLGYNLAPLVSPERYGYDIDGGAIKAARLLQKRSIKFIHGDMKAVNVAKIDVLLLINWIHDLSPEELDELMSPILHRTRYLLLDAIDVDGPEGYQYKHDFAFLGKRAKIISITKPPGEGRSFQLFEVLV